MSLIFFNIELFLCFSIMCVLILSIFFKSYKKDKDNYLYDLLHICKKFTIFILFVSIILLFNHFYIMYFFYGYNYFTNCFINFFKLIILFSVFIIILTLRTCKLDKLSLFFPYGVYEFFILLLFNILGLFCFLSAENFLLIYLGMELHSLTLSILFGLRYFSKYSAEAALKYFIISSFSSSLFLFGVSFLYGIFGTINLENFMYLNLFDYQYCLASDLYNNNSYLKNPVIISLSLVIISILVKLGTAPFHMWTLDVYEGAPTYMTLYALTIPKIAYVCFFIKLLFYFQNFSFLFFYIFKYCGIISLLIGTLGAIIQTKIKRILSYSAIANFGYILLSLSLGQTDGIIAAIIFLITYIIVTCNIFFILFALNSAKDNSELKSIFQLKTLVNSGNSNLAFLLCLLLFTLSSIPPSNIFISKYLLLYSILEDLTTISYLIIILIIISNILSCFYYIRMIRLIYFSPIDSTFLNTKMYMKNEYSLYLIISLYSILNLFLFFYPQIFLDFFDFLFLYQDNFYYNIETNSNIDVYAK
jgi:NADH-quinone oxidoreductase subunit N